jgi:hypothetical protein
MDGVGRVAERSGAIVGDIVGLAGAGAVFEDDFEGSAGFDGDLWLREGDESESGEEHGAEGHLLHLTLVAGEDSASVRMRASVPKKRWHDSSVQNART